EVYSKVPLKDMIVESNAELKEPDKLLDTSVLGDHEVKIKCIYDGAECEKTLNYTVRDTTPPTVLYSGEVTNITTGSYFDINSCIGYGDNYDSSPEMTYEGYVDTSAEGSYPLTVYVTDMFGNSTSWDMTVNVYDYLPASGEVTPRIGFGDFVDTYAGEGRHFGIDVSRWQGDIDFNAVKAAGCEFVIMRIGIYSGGELSIDRYYYNNIGNAKAAGLKVGVYFYSTDNNEADVRAHAKWVAETLDGEELDFPVAFDWENFENYQNYGMSIHDLNCFYQDFKEELKKSGYDTMLYGSKNYLENFWEYPDDEYVWLAHYVSDTTYPGKYRIWQRCGWGLINGIYGDVDLDILYE
ncbi:MAG: glycoside hydrolase, partial [Ruminococcus sp.]|nr:glycoside hydrolase [Ruminococcus sp.]